MFTLDFESEAKLSLAISANTLRVLDEAGVRIRDLPRLTGVSKEGNAMCTGCLEREGYAVSEPDPAPKSGKLLRLTHKGQQARQAYQGTLRDTEGSWRTSYGSATVDDLCAALGEIVGGRTLSTSPLAAGLEPQPGNWRAHERRPDTLPHYPMVLHRGGYPDGA